MGGSLRRTIAPIAGLLAWGLVAFAIAAEAPGSGPSPASPRVTGGQQRIHDVELDPAGVLHGVAVTSEGLPAESVTVILWQVNREMGRTKTDALGRFTMLGLRGGVYQMKAGRAEQVYRLWPARTAPPGAKSLAVVVVGGDTLVRGQSVSPLPVVSLPQAATIALVGGGAVAVPVVYHNMVMDNRVPIPVSP